MSTKVPVPHSLHWRSFVIPAAILTCLILTGCGKTLTGVPEPGPSPQPRPVLVSVTPASVLKGTTGLVLTLTGSNFLSGTQVNLGGTIIPSHLVSGTTMTANVPDSMLAQPFAAAIMVTTPPPGGGDSNGLSFIVLAAPLLGGITPNAVMAGNPDFTLVASGDMFTPQSVLRFNGIDRVTTFLSSSSLSTIIRSSELNQQNSDIPVTVYEPLVQGTTSTLTFKVLPAPDTPAGAQSINRISVAGDGTQADNYSNFAAISDTARYVAFVSYASNLIAGDTNSLSDVFVRDTCIGATSCSPSITRVSAFADGSQLIAPAAGVSTPLISGNGRIVSYTRILNTGSSQRQDVVLYDSCLGATNYCVPTTNIVLTMAGQTPDADSIAGDLSLDGRFAVIASSATNLLNTDTAHYPGVYLYDSCLGQQPGCAPDMTRVSVNTAGSELNGRSYNPHISGDGRYVVFVSDATNVDGGSAINAIYLRDTCLGTYPGTCSPSTKRISTTSGMPNTTACAYPKMSRDAQLVAFACDLGMPTVTYIGYVARTCIGTNSQCWTGVAETLLTNSNQRIFDALPLAITNGGRVAFPGHVEGLADVRDIFVRQVCVQGTPGCAETTVRVSVPPAGLFTQTDSWTGTLSADGSTVVFTSSFADFVSGDTNGFNDIFLAPLINPLPLQ